MKSLLKQTVLAFGMMGLVSGANAIAPDFFEQLDAESRPMEDKNRDGARRPYQVMRLLGVEEGMTAVDIGAGGGWYTRVLAAAVGENGRVISQAGPRGLRGDVNDIEAMDQVEISIQELGELESNIADVAVTALNIHHSNDERASTYFMQIRNILKPGGVAAVIDHEGSPGMSEEAAAHRIDPETVRGWIEGAGLEIVELSDLLHTNADDHSMDIRHPSLGRDTDRFLFVVRNPD